MVTPDLGETIQAEWTCILPGSFGEIHSHCP
jgi:hypothetical protein